MADEDVDNDDQWLYGDNTDGNPNEEEKAKSVDERSSPAEEVPPPIEPAPVTYPEESINEEVPSTAEYENQEKENGDTDNDQEDGELRQNGDDEEDLDDDSDDDVNVVIGDYKTTTSYPTQPLNIKRGVLTTALVDKSKTVQQPGKFQVEEFEQIGTINGVPASDYNLDSLEDKPWRKPGADITDYFNYGFNEDTWKAYCERQKRIRISESGVGIVPLNAIGLPRGPVSINENNKYPNQNFMQGSNIRPVQPTIKSNEQPKMNTIQVMTADRREYSRKPGFPDMSVPPPTNYSEPFPPADYGFNPEPEPFYGGYEPTQDSQWMHGPITSNWQPSEIKTLTGASPPVQSMHGMGPPLRSVRSPSRRSSSRERDNERDRERERERESRSHSVKPRDYEREKSRRRERSRSRSRRHRSRLRSPGHRSHKKKEV